MRICFQTLNSTLSKIVIINIKKSNFFGLFFIASKKHIVMFWKKLMWFWSKKLSKNLSITLLKRKRGLK
jgi:hypothetical protein